MKRNTILWADDDADDLQMMRDVLLKSDKDFNIVEVGNGKEALKFLDGAKSRGDLPCLIILDINMPILDGKETLSIIRTSEEFKSIPTVVFTTSESELDRMFCKRYDTEMISKPPTFRRLEIAVNKLLGFAVKGQ